ncbi:MAG: hypothetical protein ACK56I_36425, partial [bacterium]
MKRTRVDRPREGCRGARREGGRNGGGEEAREVRERGEKGETRYGPADSDFSRMLLHGGCKSLLERRSVACGGQTRNGQGGRSSQE